MTAGTIFSYKSSRFAIPSNAIHWMYLDRNANIIFSKVINQDTWDERPVGIHNYGADAIIVASHRDETNVISGSNAAAQAGVEIVSISKTTGTSGIRKLISSSDPDYRNLYPMASLRLDDQLYVCGYAALSNNSVLPELDTPKRAFIFKYDLANNTLSGIRFIESTIARSTYDFDMATCMKRISSGIWIGGSMNNVRAANGGAMMNRVVDPATLQDIPSATAFNDPAQGTYESSYDVIETGNGDLFVFGNTYGINNASGTTTYPIQIHITAVQPNLMPYPGNARWQLSKFNGPWGVNVLQDQNDKNTVIINGLTSSRTCNQMPVTDNSNINPFLAGMSMEVVPGSNDISVIPRTWSTVLSINGTGTSSLSSSYYQLGRFMSNILTPPVSAVRDYASSSDIILTCPLWNASTNRLNFKLIRAANNGEIPGCSWAKECEPINGITFPVTLSFAGTNTAGTGAVTDLNHTIADYLPNQIDDCNGKYKPAPDNETGIIAETSQNTSCKLYPNPADKELVIEWNNAAQTVQVRITDIHGRIVTSRQLDGAHSLKLDVSAYPAGLYFYTIQSGDVTQSGKVTIRH